LQGLLRDLRPLRDALLDTCSTSVSPICPWVCRRTSGPSSGQRAPWRASLLSPVARCRARSTAVDGLQPPEARHGMAQGRDGSRGDWQAGGGARRSAAGVGRAVAGAGLGSPPTSGGRAGACRLVGWRVCARLQAMSRPG
jgi:hypothetical protein